MTKAGWTLEQGIAKLRTNRIAVLQERLATTFLSSLPLRIQPLPFAMPVLKELVQFHPARSGDAGIAWLIQTLREVADESRV